MMPHADLAERLTTVPGIDKVVAWTLISEIGADMSPFPDAGHLASWAGLCPGNNESAGKRKSGRTRKGNRYLKRIMVQAAWAAAHTKNTFLSASFFRLARRQGTKKAAVALAHRILTIVYHIIRDGESYREYGGDFFDKLHPQKTAHRLLSRLQSLGFDVSAVAVRSQPAQPISKPAAASGRGRPCKCSERGIACPHPNRPLRVTPQSGPSPRSRPTPAPDPDGPHSSRIHCRRCSAWKLDHCIHVKPRL